MNIFEQYGIKEVADCTLYAIALDKNDDEVYIPLMYFDTLKVSSLEQTAEDTSARGGIGNPNLITWDFGKEITVSLEDALYTPASQSLMWGGKFGLDKTRIKGFWNPIYYSKDDYGKEVYLENAPYKYTDEFLGYEDNKKKILYGYKEKLREEPVEYKCELFVPNNGQPAEKANLIIDNFSSFRFSEKKIGIQDSDDRYFLTTIASTEDNSMPWSNNYSYITNGSDVLFDYEWLDCEVQMTSLQGEQDIYYAEHVDVLIRADSEGFNKKILVKKHDDSDSYYNSQLDFYKKAKYMSGNTILEAVVKVGTFYINNDFNYDTVIQDSFYSIENGIDDVPYLDRMEKCIAKQTFCINTDKNTLLNYYKDLNKYAHAELTVYIDPKTMRAYEPNSDSFQRKDGTLVNGNLRIIKQNETYYKWTRSKAPEHTTLGHQVVIDAKHFPGTYRLVGETFARRRKDGKDERFQFEIPLCKMSSNTNLTLEAEGDPTTFSMELKVLQRSDGVMMKLTQYEVETKKYNGQASGSTEIVPTAAKYKGDSCYTCEEATISIVKSGDLGYEILLPLQDDYYCVPVDCLVPYTDGQAYLMLPKTLEDAKTIYSEYERYMNLKANGQVTAEVRDKIDFYRNQLLVKVKEQTASILINNRVYKVIGGVESDGDTFIVQSNANVKFTIALGGEN